MITYNTDGVGMPKMKKRLINLRSESGRYWLHVC